MNNSLLDEFNYKIGFEIWKEVVGYEDSYEVSDLGRVRTKLGKTTTNSNGIVRSWSQRVLKEKNPNGRDVRVDLWKDGKPKSYLVHRLVAYAFIPTVEGKNSINHIDGNPRNNHVSNLEWCDHKENNNHAFDNGLIKTGNKVVVINLQTNEELEFRSMSKANDYLGMKVRKLHGMLQRSKNNEVIYENHLIKKVIY